MTLKGRVAIVSAMGVDVLVGIDRQIAESYEQYAGVLVRRDEYFVTEGQWHERVNQMPAFFSVACQLLGIGRPKNNVGNGLVEKERIIDLISKRPGSYELVEFQIGSLSPWDSMKFRYGFNYNLGAHTFRVRFWRETVNIVLAEEPDPKIEIPRYDPKVPLLRLPRGFKIPIIIDDYKDKGWHVAGDSLYALWEPELDRFPRVLSIDELPREINYADKFEEAAVYTSRIPYGA